MKDLNRTRTIMFAGLLLGAYIALLMGLVFVGQQHLRQSLYDQAHLALEKQAAAVGYFVTEQQAKIEELARSAVLDNYFANRALGMSMQYGLRASLLAVEEAMERLRQRTQLQGVAVYSRISLVDRHGIVLVSAGDTKAQNRPAVDPVDILAKGVSLELGTGDQASSAYIYAAVEHHHQLSGLIVARINLVKALSSLLKQPENSENANGLVLVGPEGSLLISGAREEEVSEPAASEDLIVVPVANTPFLLKCGVALGAGQGVLTSPWFLLALSLITVPVFAGIYYLLRLNDRNLLLQNRYFLSRRRQKALRHYRDQLDFSTDLIVVIDPESSRYLDVNQTMCDYFGFSRKALLNQRVIDLSGTYRTVEQWQRFVRKLRSKGRLTIEDNGLRHDGTSYCVEINAHYADAEKQDRIVAIYRDISERKQSELALHEANQRFTSVLDGIDATVYVADMHTHEVLYVNPRIRNRFGDVVGQKCWQSLYCEQNRPCDFCTNEKLLDKQGQPAGTYVWDYQDPVSGEWFHCADRAIPWHDGRYVRLHVATDITSRMRDQEALKEAHQQLEMLAYHDPLTKLANRRLFIDLLSRSFAQADRANSRLAICYLDLDGFKEINDKHGHELGDKLLKQVSERLLHTLRSEDLVARWGGDEFALLINGQDNERTCASTLDRLSSTLAAPYDLEEGIFHVTASIGVTVYPQDNGDPDTLLRHADQAMYLAKQRGRNQYYFFDPVQDRRVHARREHLGRIAEAIENNELQLFYQPKVNMAQGKLFGVEALVRWQHPEQGLLPPNAFLPIIEGHKLQYVLDWWVLKAGINQAALWRAEGMNLVVGINVSPSTVQYPDFTSQLMRLMVEEEISAESIELEIIESDAIDDLDAVSEVIRQCAEIGVRFALDDYGTGYSSLTFIRRLPVQTLKIDQTFVKDMLRDQDDLNIVEGVIGLARAFGREVIAEGVEDTEIGVRLLELGCSWAQGYAIARPMPPTEIAAWAKQYSFPTEWLEAAKKLSVA